MPTDKKLSTGANDRPKNETIAQTGPGLPEDSSSWNESEEAMLARVKADLEAQISANRQGGETNSGPSGDAIGTRPDKPRKDRADLGGADEIEGADAEDDTYD